jgi:ABC-type enterobactin transport system permease subunit
VSTQTQQNRLITALTLVALVAMMAAFFAPIWWVSLTAPNYPKDAFPDGIRIHFPL